MPMIIKRLFEAVLLRLARCEVRLNCVEEAGLVQKPPAPAPAKEQEEELEPVVKKSHGGFWRNIAETVISKFKEGIYLCLIPEWQICRV